MAEADDPNELGQSLLHACRYNLKKEAIELIQKGAEVNVTDEDGRSPLYWAVFNDNIELAEHLLQKGAPVNVTNEDGWRPLHWAAIKGNFKVAEALLQKGADANAKSRRGNTPLIFACQYGHREVASLFIGHGAEVNVTNEDGQSPLHWAAINGSFKVAEALLQKGADANAEDYRWNTPLLRACEYGRGEVASLLIGHGAQADVLSLLYAVLNENPDVSLAQLLVEKGALANLTDTTKARHIEEAVAKCDWSTARDLLGKVWSAPKITTWIPDYEDAVRTQGSVVIDVTRTIFMGPPCTGKSSLKHLLAYNRSKEINTSTPIMETPAIVSISSEQYAFQESSSSWKVVSEQDMAASIRIACRDRKYACNEEHDLPISQPSTFQHEPSKPTSTVAQPVLEHHGKSPVPGEDKGEVEGPWVDFERAHSALVHNLGTGVEERLLQNARFVHLLDSGGQPSFQDVLPLLIRIPCTYVIVFDASQDLDEPLSITYRTEDATVKLCATSETGWQMLLRLLSSVQAMEFKSSNMADFMKKLGQPPQLRIFLVGTFKDSLVLAGRLEEAKANLHKRIGQLKKKPYYKYIVRASNGQPFYLINNMMHLDTPGSSEEDLAHLIDLRQQLSRPAGSLTLEVPLGWFHFEMVTRSVQQKFFKTSELQQCALQLKCVSGASEFRSLLTLFHYLGFFTFFDHKDISDTVCTDNACFLKEVSKLLAVQFINSPRTPAVAAFKEEGVLTLDEELASELGLCVGLDRAWLSRSLWHLGVIACTSPCRYFMPAALRSDSTQDAAVGTVDPLLVAFTFKVDEFHVTQDLPRGIYCHMAVELANSGWTVIPQDSTRLTIKYQWEELDIALTELPGCISVVPIMSTDEDCNTSKLHNLCSSVRSTVELAFQESAKAVFDDQFTTRADVVCGVKCHCDNPSPHLAVPRGNSICCTLTQKRLQRCLPSQQVWFSAVEGAELCPHPSNHEILYLMDSSIPQKGGGREVVPQTEAPVPHPAPVMTEAHPMAKQRPMEPSDESPPNVAETGGSGKHDTLSQRVNDRPGLLMLLRTYVSRKAAGKGRALLEGVGLDSDTIEACFQSNPLNEEGAVQAGLIRWKDSQSQDFPPTWKVLLEAMEYAGVAQQHVAGLKAALCPK